MNDRIQTGDRIACSPGDGHARFQGSRSVTLNATRHGKGSNRRFEFELRRCFGWNSAGFVLAMHPTMSHRLGALGRPNSHPGRYPLDGQRKQCPPGGHPGSSRRSPSGDGSGHGSWRPDTPLASCAAWGTGGRAKSRTSVRADLGRRGRKLAPTNVVGYLLQAPAPHGERRR
jgi:hypothetical protein